MAVEHMQARRPRNSAENSQGGAIFLQGKDGPVDRNISNSKDGCGGCGAKEGQRTMRSGSRY